ncbi:MAG: hypothetical protein LBT04_02075 [Prevotellaceae bacterium]|jgi:hypothetical protein|nr:hypothetical protein [Prevotellaceae bacterium]
MEYPTLINGVMHSWSQVAVNINSPAPVTGITKLNYNSDRKINLVMGAGSQAIGLGYGNWTHTASLTLTRDEIENLRESVPTRRLQDIAPFDVVIMFVPNLGNKKVTHILKDCVILNDPLEISQDDTSNSAELTLQPSNILR